MLAHAILASAEQAWPPFVLVAGLLLIGAVAADDGLFEALGARLARTSLGPRSLLLALLALVAAVTAVLNLDTSVVFLTPVLVHAARRRGLDERPFLYGSVFMANSASLLLPRLQPHKPARAPQRPRERPHLRHEHAAGLDHRLHGHGPLPHSRLPPRER